MSKSIVMILLLAAAVIKTQQATFQTLQPDDVSISIHHYKHSNKALQRKKFTKKAATPPSATTPQNASKATSITL